MIDRMNGGVRETDYGLSGVRVRVPSGLRSDSVLDQ